MHYEESLTLFSLSPSSVHHFKEQEMSGRAFVMVLRYFVYIFEIGLSYT